MRQLKPEQIAAVSSTYLREGRRHETWTLDSVQIDGEYLHASVSMSALPPLPAGAEFHLTIFATLEFASQLMIIYAHDWAGLDAKIREGWMVESHTRTVRAIRSSTGIQVKMHARSMRRRGANLYCDADFTVTDSGGGLFEVQLKGFLA